MKEILFLITTLSGGGAERVLVDLVNQLDPLKYHVTVQTIIDIGILRQDLSDKVSYKTIISTGNRMLRSFLTKIVLKLIPAKLVYQLFIKGCYDVEISFLEGVPTKIISASSSKNTKKYAWVHTDLIRYFDSVCAYSSAMQNKKAYEKFDRIICVSNDVRERFIERFKWEKENVHVVYNTINVNRIIAASQMDANIPLENGTLRVTACGRLEKQKSFDRLLRVHKRIIDEGLRHTLWIIGEGAERANLEKYIGDNHLEKTVTLFGFRDNPYPYFAHSDLFVCASVAEGYSTVITEACILGVPVLTTEVAGAREPVDCPRFSEVCENEEDALYSALKGILSKPERLNKYRKEMSAKSAFLCSNDQLKVFEELLRAD